MIDGFLSDEDVYESFLVGIITVVHEQRHTVDLQVHRRIEPLKDVALFRNPGNYSLPNIGDIAIVIFDARLQPVVIGFYPQFVHDGIQIQKDYFLRAGEVLLQTQRGGRFMMLNSGIIKLVNWLDQGIEIDEPTGSFFLRSPSRKDTLSGVTERAGQIKRKFSISLNGIPTVLESNEVLVKKIGTITTPGTLIQNDIAGAGVELYEKKTEIKVPGSITTVTPNGLPLYEETIGSAVVKNDSVSGIYSEELHTTTALPLRKKIVYYDASGTTPILTEEIDTNGNLHLFISPTATSGININALVPLIAQFLSVNVTASTTIDLTAPTINFNGGSDFVALSNLLVLAFNTHTHTGNLGAPTSTPIVPWTAPMIGSLTVKSS